MWGGRVLGNEMLSEEERARGLSRSLSGKERGGPREPPPTTPSPSFRSTPRGGAGGGWGNESRTPRGGTSRGGGARQPDFPLRETHVNSTGDSGDYSTVCTSEYGTGFAGPEGTGEAQGMPQGLLPQAMLGPGQLGQPQMFSSAQAQAQGSWRVEAAALGSGGPDFPAQAAPFPRTRSGSAAVTGHSAATGHSAVVDHAAATGHRVGAKSRMHTAQ